MLALVATVFIASLTGSLHCAGMCGAFVAFAVSGPGAESVARTKLQTAYHGGRLITYTLLGAISGALGAALDLGGAAVGLQNAAAILAGATMVVFGTLAILRIQGVRVPRAPIPAAFQKAFVKGQDVALNQGPLARAGLIGLLTTLLPCGWLYAFAVVAAGTASPFLGALTMAVFWAGTLPVLVALGFGVQKLAGALGRHVPTLTAAALIAIGLFTVFQRTTIAPFTNDPSFIVPASFDDAVRKAGTLDSADAPCCHVNDQPK